MSQKPILLITHSDALPVNAVTKDLAARGQTLIWRRPWLGESLPDQDSIAGVVIFGGPQFVTEIDQEPWMPAQIDWIAEFVRRGGRTLGLCLGAQMIAHGLGGRVWRFDDETSEIGFYDIEPVGQEGAALFGDVRTFYQWHLEGLDPPEGAVLLARNNTFPHQGFRWGERCWGFQFHPEMTLDMVERWTSFVSENKAFMFERPNAQHPPAHFEGWENYADAVHRWRGSFLDRWLAA